MEQDTQTSENNNQTEGGVIFRKPKKKNNKKVILLIIAVAVIIAVVASYFLFFSNKEDETAPVLEDKKIEVDKELDSDQDGLPDYIEKVLGTNLNNSDTDGDGYSDFEEIKNGYNPLDDKKYSQEEWGGAKEKIRSEDEELYKSVFGIGDVKENNPILINEDFSSPEATFKVYILALESKDINLYSKTLDKESLEKMNEISAVSNRTINDSLNNVQVDIWKKANYKISEQANKYAIMAPVFREQQINTPERVLPTALMVMPDIYFHQEDNLWKIDFVTTMSDLTARMVARANAAAKETDTNLPEDEKLLKQIAENWKASFK